MILVLLSGCGVIAVSVADCRTKDISDENIVLLVVRSNCNGDPGFLVGGDGIRFVEYFDNFDTLSDGTCVDVAVTSIVGVVPLQWDVVE